MATAEMVTGGCGTDYFIVSKYVSK